MKLILERIEETQNGEKVLIFEKENGGMIEIWEDHTPNGFLQAVLPNDVISAEMQDNKIISYSVAKEETQAQKENMQTRLSALFHRNK